MFDISYLPEIKRESGGSLQPKVSASKEGVVLFPPPIDILGKTNIF